jgi:hypothetical protein
MRRPRKDAVDSAAFLEWLEDWKKRQRAITYPSHGNRRRPGGSTALSEWYSMIERPVATIEDLAELAGCSPKAFSRARTTGRVSINVVDRTLVAAGGDVLLVHLYPELYEGQAA